MLLNKIRTGHGKNLRIPLRKNRVSRESIDLLQKLLEMDPKNRINWYDFFSHSIFDTRGKGDVMPMRNSVAVNKFFERAKAERAQPDRFQDRVLLDPLDMEEESPYLREVTGVTELDSEDFDSPGRKISPESNKFAKVPGRAAATNPHIHHRPMSDPLENVFQENMFRYIHEKNKMLYLLVAVKKLRVLLKNPIFLTRARPLYLLILMVAKKSSTLSEMTLHSLQSMNNIFKLAQFQEFCTKSQEYLKIVQLLKKDQNTIFEYERFLVGLWNEMKIDLLPEDKEIGQIMDPAFNDLLKVDRIALEMFNSLRNGPLPQSINTSPKLKHEFYIGLVFAAYAIKCEKYIPFKRDDVKFKWKNFTEKHEMYNGNELEEVLQMIKI